MLRVKQVILTILTTVSCYGQTVHLSGTYLDQRLNPITDTRVRYLLDDGPAHSAFTDADGHFVLTLDDIRSHNDILTPAAMWVLPRLRTKGYHLRRRWPNYPPD
ncbi:MAG: hypothetical protein K9M19_02915 [Candidatus Marinimicrobia bacterium]|nr:hypothetical protein [Candidatus Neomarinimicrobiota bacterium]